MRLMQTRNKRLVFGILFSALIVGIMLTIGQVPLAVSQPVTIPVKAIKGAIPMDGANPIWEGVPGVIIPLSGQTITTPMHPNISVKSVFVKAVTNGKELGMRLDWADQTKNDTAIGPQDFRDQAAVMFPVNTAGAPPFQCMDSPAVRSTFGGGMLSGKRISGRTAPVSGTWTINIPASSGTTISKSRPVG